MKHIIARIILTLPAVIAAALYLGGIYALVADVTVMLVFLAAMAVVCWAAYAFRIIFVWAEKVTETADRKE